VSRYLQVILLSLAAACAGVGRMGGLPDSEVEALPPDVRASYDLFTKRCSRCHSLSRPLDASIAEPDHWRMYVARMRRNPGSGISPDDAEKILVFLFYWSDLKRGEEVEQH